ncbi:MAG: M4 family metallopeptidase, partial [Planctomycetes bacterium]|nr:M4 family metallopeptidase [Planctomycetota bacterium]
NSHPAERDCFYHVNLVHNYITGLDPNFTNIDYSMPCVVNIDEYCSAFWDGYGINFFTASVGCYNTGQMPSAVYHEYGHGINARFYEQMGSQLGMINGATDEGLADVTSCLIEDMPQVGRGYYGPGTFVRDLDNDNRYPEDFVDEVHLDGLIIGGAFWDLRMATSLELARELSHFARYGLPDDTNAGRAFA